MAGAQPQEVINPDASLAEEFGAGVVGGLRPFFIWTAIATLVLTAIAFMASFSLNMLTSLVIPVIVGFVAAVLS